MPLPILKSEPNNRNLEQIKEKIKNLPAANDNHFERLRLVRPQMSSKPPLNLREANQEANKKAIEISRGDNNPLVPLITQISNSLLGTNAILKDILKAIKSMTLNLESSMEDSRIRL
jgi:hypothetical protein